MLLFAGAVCAQTSAPVPDRAAGERIFLEGRLPSGGALQGVRDSTLRIDGAAGACVNCHRRSGLGTIEGHTMVPPIIGPYLFRAPRELAADVSVPHIPGYLPEREPYTDDSLAEALRTGRRPGGGTYGKLMPRFDLDDEAMKSLVAYLHELGTGRAPGLDNDTLQFATITTPDADPTARAAMLAVIAAFVADQNRGVSSGAMASPVNRPLSYRVARHWHVEEWRLEGPPANWAAELHAKNAAHPVFAVLAGLGGRDWSPVHRFCEAEHVPCLFPNVDLPVVAEDDFYPIYFSRGVLLEADLIAARLRESIPAAARADASLKRVVQVYDASDVGVSAAGSLRASLAGTGIVVEDRVRQAASSAPMTTGLYAGLGAGDVLVLWLRPEAVAALPKPPPGLERVFLSGLMAGMEHAPLDAAWRERARLTYPEDLPEARRSRMLYPVGWFNLHGLAVSSERVQVNTYLACMLVGEAIDHMFDAFIPDFLNERLEMVVGHRRATAYYPLLGLAPGQRFASKGGYLVRFVDSTSARVVADGEWVAP